jgi:hypothetical protein
MQWSLDLPIYFFQFTGQSRLMEDKMYFLVDSDFNSRVKPGKKAVIVTSQGNPVDRDCKTFLGFS